MSWFTKRPKPDNVSDEELLAGYRSHGDMELLAKLYERYLPLIYGVCLKYLKDEDRSKDGVMQIFEELVQKAATFDVKKFKNWIYVLSRNYCLMQIRAGYKMRLEDLDEVMETAFVPHHDNEGKEEYLQLLERCMKLLSAGQHQCVDLFYLKEKSYKEIVDETGFNLNEVKSFIQNGKRNLKLCLQQHSEKQ